MSDPKAMTPEQAAIVAAGVSVAATFAAASGNPAVAAAVTAATGILNGIMAANGGADYTAADFQKALDDFDLLDAQGHALQNAAP